MINRRSFLKGVGVALVVPFVPMPIPDGQDNAWPQFKPKEEYGNSLAYVGKCPKEFRGSFIHTMLKEDMERIVPPRFRRKVQYRMKIPSDYGRCKGVMWHYNSKNKREPRGFAKHGYIVL